MPMRIGRAIRWFLICTLSLVGLSAVVMYVQASRIPADYLPVQLSARQKHQAVKEFWSKVQEFGNSTQMNEPFEWSVGQTELNRYLASMDEIAASTPSGEPGTVYREMEKAGLAEPAIALHDGVLTLMVRSKEHAKILSVDVSFALTDDKKLRVKLGEVDFD